MEQQQNQIDLRLVVADALAQIQKNMVIITDAFNTVYNEAVKLQLENKQLKDTRIEQVKKG